MNINNEPYSRLVSPNELLYIHFQELYSTFAIQFIIEGNGSITKESFKNAVEKASEACPGSRSLFKNKRWVDTKNPPPVYFISDTHFNDTNFNEFSLLKEKMDIYNKSAVEIYVFESAPVKILFRIFHGLMDGKGALLWVENIFKVLRGEPPISATSTETDLSALKNLGAKKIKNNLHYNIETFEKRSILSKYDICWRRISFNKNFSGVVAKIATVLTNTFISEHNKFLIPVDIRRHLINVNSTANLTLPIFLETKKGEDWKDINARLISHLKNSEELNLNNADFGLLTKLPAKIIKTAIRFTELYQNMVSKYMVGGIISHLGRLDLEKFSTDTFKAESFYSLPLQQPLVPLSIVILENTNNSSGLQPGTEIVIASYTQSFTEKEMDTLVENIRYFLSEERIYTELNETKIDYEDGKTILDLFEEQVKQSPESISLVCNGTSLTYKELDRKSDNLASVLFHSGIGKNDYVGLFLERGIDLIVSIIAVLKTGAAYVPIDTNFHTEKIKSIFNKGSLALLLTTKTCHEKVEKNGINFAKILFIDEIDFSKEINFIKVLRSTRDIVYQIYTSGSTGIPKGVNIEDKSLKNYLYWAKKMCGSNKDNRFPLFTSISVDLTATSIFLPLISGGSIEIFRGAVNHAILDEILNNPKIDCIKLTPTHLKLIVGTDIPIKNKRIVIVGGEQLNTSTSLKIQTMFGENCKIINEYGPTEATIGCTYHIFNKNFDKDNYVPIGKPIDNTGIMLLDDRHNLVTPGETGELYIFGDCLAQGYYNNDEMNRQKFLYINGQRCYKTGDLAKLNSNNQYVYLGRIDNQVKINGNRVELGEIEYLINTFPGIENSIVTFKEPSNFIAFFTASASIDTKAIDEYMRRMVSSYMVPKYFVQVDYFPVGDNGKIDINALLGVLAKIENRKFEINLNVPEQILYSAEEETLFSIWREVLELPSEKFGLEDEFYNLGGDSLNFISMIGVVSKRMVPQENENQFVKDSLDLYGRITIRELTRIIKRVNTVYK